MFNDFEKRCLFFWSYMSSTFFRHSAFLWITFTSPKNWITLYMCCIYTVSTASSGRKSFTKARRPLTSMDHLSPFLSKIASWIFFINLSVFTRGITWFLNFLFSLYYNIKPEKTVHSKVNPPDEVLHFLLKASALLEGVILSAISVIMYSRC